jgi:hypothetical protein
MICNFISEVQELIPKTSIYMWIPSSTVSELLKMYIGWKGSDIENVNIEENMRWLHCTVYTDYSGYSKCLPSVGVHRHSFLR